MALEACSLCVSTHWILTTSSWCGIFPILGRVSITWTFAWIYRFFSLSPWIASRHHGEALLSPLPPPGLHYFSPALLTWPLRWYPIHLVADLFFLTYKNAPILGCFVYRWVKLHSDYTKQIRKFISSRQWEIQRDEFNKGPAWPRISNTLTAGYIAYRLARTQILPVAQPSRNRTSSHVVLAGWSQGRSQAYPQINHSCSSHGGLSLGWPRWYIHPLWLGGWSQPHPNPMNGCCC